MPIAAATDSDNMNDFLKNDIGNHNQVDTQSLFQTYIAVLNSIKSELSLLSRLEEVMVQLRCQKQIMREIKIFVSQSYVYARSTFYRRDRQIKDIRVLIGRVSEFGSDMDQLVTNVDFMKLAHDKIYEAMTMEIHESMGSILNSQREA